MGHDPPKSPLKGRGSSYGKKKVLGGAGGKPSTKITEGRSGRNHGTGGLSGLPTVVRQQWRIGFLEGPPKPPALAWGTVGGPS